MLEKQVVIDQIEITRNGHIQVRKATLILEDGKEVGKTYHRHVVAPGDDYSKENEKVRAVAEVIHTQDVVNTYKQAQETI